MRRCVSPRTSTAPSESAGCGAPPRPARRRSRRSSPANRSTPHSPSRRLGYELDRQHIAVIAWLQAHEEGHDTHAAMEAAIAEVRDRLGAHARARPPARHPVDRRLDRHPRRRLAPPAGRPPVRHAGRARGPDRDRRTRPRHRRISPEPQRGRRTPAASPSSRRRPSGTITRYSRVALAAMATADLDQARTFVQRELRGLLPPTTISPPGSRPRCAPTSTSTPAAAAPPNGSASTRTPSATGSSRRGDPRAQRRSAHARAPRRARTRAPRSRSSRLTQSLPGERTAGR